MPVPAKPIAQLRNASFLAANDMVGNIWKAGGFPPCRISDIE